MDNFDIFGENTTKLSTYEETYEPNLKLSTMLYESMLQSLDADIAITEAMIKSDVTEIRFRRANVNEAAIEALHEGVISKIFNSIVNGIKWIIEKLFAFFKMIFKFIGNIISKIINAISNFFGGGGGNDSKSKEEAKDDLNKVIDSLPDEQLKQDIKNNITQTENIIKHAENLNKETKKDLVESKKELDNLDKSLNEITEKLNNSMTQSINNSIDKIENESNESQQQDLDKMKSIISKRKDYSYFKTQIDAAFEQAKKQQHFDGLKQVLIKLTNKSLSVLNERKDKTVVISSKIINWFEVDRINNDNDTQFAEFFFELKGVKYIPENSIIVDMVNRVKEYVKTDLNNLDSEIKKFYDSQKNELTNLKNTFNKTINGKPTDFKTFQTYNSMLNFLNAYKKRSDDFNKYIDTVLNTNDEHGIFNNLKRHFDFSKPDAAMNVSDEQIVKHFSTIRSEALGLAKIVQGIINEQLKIINAAFRIILSQQDKVIDINNNASAISFADIALSPISESYLDNDFIKEMSEYEIEEFSENTYTDNCGRIVCNF